MLKLSGSVSRAMSLPACEKIDVLEIPRQVAGENALAAVADFIWHRDMMQVSVQLCAAQQARCHVLRARGSSAVAALELQGRHGLCAGLQHGFYPAFLRFCHVVHLLFPQDARDADLLVLSDQNVTSLCGQGLTDTRHGRGARGNSGVFQAWPTRVQFVLDTWWLRAIWLTLAIFGRSNLTLVWLFCLRQGRFYSRMVAICLP